MALSGYSQFVYNKAADKPNYATYGTTTVVQQQSSVYYTRNGNYSATNTPSAEDDQTIKQYACGETNSGPDIPDIGALGAGDFGWDGDNEYLSRSLETFIKGKYSDEDPTALAITGNVVAGLANVDLPLDVRDLVYDLEHWGQSDNFTQEIILDAIALIPLSRANTAEERFSQKFSKYSPKL